MNREEIEKLAAKVTDGTAGSEELARYNHLCNQMGAEGVAWDAAIPGSEEEYQQTILKRIRQKVTPGVRRSMPGWQRWIAAAAVMVLFAGAAYYAFGRRTEPVQAPALVKKAESADALPAADKATLTLADGTVVVLDAAGEKELATLPGVKVTKKNGVITYKYDNSLREQPPVQVPQNIVATPRGGKYKLELPDGTNVWLNASSSIRFPVFFSNEQNRIVSIEGEAYFEVAKAATRFIVKTDDYDIEVLGTQFNVNCYHDEPVRATTLLEGSVSLKFSEKVAVKLKPGDQLQSWNNTIVRQYNNTDTEGVIAWKNGRFQFNETDLPTIMRQIMRWYDVDVVYESEPNNKKFTADLSRNTKLSEFLAVLNESGVKFSLKGKTLSVKN